MSRKIISAYLSKKKQKSIKAKCNKSAVYIENHSRMVEQAVVQHKYEIHNPQQFSDVHKVQIS